MTQPHECTKIAEMMPVGSSGHLHDCKKKDCFFCYEIKRISIPRKTEIQFDDQPIKVVKKLCKVKKPRGLNGCDRLILFANIGKTPMEIGEILQNKSLDVIRNNTTIWRKRLGFKKIGNCYVVPYQLR